MTLRRLGSNLLTTLPASVGLLGMLQYLCVYSRFKTGCAPSRAEVHPDVCRLYSYVDRNWIAEVPPELGNATHLLNLCASLESAARFI